MSLRLRLTLWVLSMFVLLHLLLVAIFWLYLRGSLHESFDKTLLARAGDMAAELSTELPDLTDKKLSKLSYADNLYVQFASFRVLIVGPDGYRLGTPGLIWPSAITDLAQATISTGEAGYTSIETDWFLREDKPDKQTRAVSVLMRDSAGARYSLVLATSTAHVRSQASLILQVMVLTTVVGLLASTVSGWYIAGLATAPIDQMSELASKLTPESLSTRIELSKPRAEMKLLVEALNAARMRMRSAFEVQERFLSNVSHEIKTPIATLLVEAQTIDKTALPKQALSFIKMTEDEMRRLGKLVESFLTLTRIRDGKGSPTFSKLLVNELVLDSLTDCTRMAKQYQVRLAPTILSDDDTLSTTIEGDNDLLRTLIDNLVRNAIRFTPQDHVIQVIAKRPNVDYVEIFVLDEGPGLPAAMLDNAFDRFVQAPDEVRRGRGHGLGLSIAQAVAELHGGVITVRNREHRGAEFHVVLPLRQGISSRKSESNVG